MSIGSQSTFNEFGTINGLSDDYFSIDSILAGHERVPCRFETTLPKLGMLDSSIENEDITEGTKLELPLWIAKQLVNQRVIKIEVPKYFKDTYRQILQADANVVDLGKLSLYFYKFGLHLLQYPFPDSTDISKILIQTFQQRARKIMDVSQNPLLNCALNTKFQLSLDRDELQLFLTSQKVLHDFKNWQLRKSSRITTADFIENHKKRKRASTDP